MLKRHYRHKRLKIPSFGSSVRAPPECESRRSAPPRLRERLRVTHPLGPHSQGFTDEVIAHVKQKNKIKMDKTRQCQVLTMAAVRRHEGGRPRGPWAAELEGHGGWARGRTRARKWPGFSFTSRWPDLDLGFIAPLAAMSKSGGEIPRIEAE